MENHPFFRVFQEIRYHNSRLSVLGTEAMQVLDNMRREGMPNGILEPLVGVAKKAANIERNIDVNCEKEEKRRCKWWNKGFCWERVECTYSHYKGECEYHLNGGSTTKSSKVQNIQERKASGDE